MQFSRPTINRSYWLQPERARKRAYWICRRSLGILGALPADGYQSKSSNAPQAFFQEDTIRDFALRVGQLSFQLTYSEDYTPEELFIDNGSSVSSGGLLPDGNGGLSPK